MLRWFFAALSVFVISAVWLFYVLNQDYATYDWTSVPATYGTSTAERSGVRARRKNIHTSVKYLFDGVEYEGWVDDFIVEGSGTVYVNPDDPTEVVGVQGPNLQHYGRPLIFTIVSGLFLIVLGLIAFSPSDD